MNRCVIQWALSHGKLLSFFIIELFVVKIVCIHMVYLGLCVY